MERHEYRLGDVCTLRAGSAFKKKYQGLPDGDLPFIKVSDMNLPANQFRIHEANNWVSHATAQDIGARSFPAGTVVFAKIGEALKQNRVRLLTVPTLIDNNMMGAIPNPDLVDPYYLMLALAFAGLDRWATGTAMPYLTQGTLNEVPIELPDLRMQRKVAAVVAAYDELIENNLRRIEILEEMAKTLYREWFVNFRFPGHEDVDLVDSPLGPIPEGWSAGTFGDLAENQRVNVNPLKFPDEQFDHFSFAAFDGGRLPSTEFGETMKSGKLLVERDSVLLAKLNPRIPRVWFARPCGVRRSVASSEFLVLTSRTGSALELVYATCRDPSFQSRLATMSGGTSTSHQRVKIDDLMRLPIPIASKRVVEAFVAVTRPIYRLVTNLAIQNANLRATRDLLLPKLVSGEIDVSDLDIDTEWLAS